MAAASIALLVAAGCSGEQAFSPRDGSPPGGGSGGSSMGGNGGGSSAGSTGGSISGVAGDGGGSGGAAASGGSGGASATGGTGNADAGVDRPTGPGALGTMCDVGGECMTGYCADHVCCDMACTGTCMTCAGDNKGRCVPIDDGSDPGNECPEQPVSTCGSTGVCNGAGACRVHAAGLVCYATAACDNMNPGVLVPSRVCDGAGSCVPNTPQNCGGFLCTLATCPTTCAADNACVSGGFCSASTCVCGAATCTTRPNLVGNGDLETGAATGWSVFGGSGTLNISSTAAAGVAHGGQYSISVTGRGQYYQGPGINIPTGTGKYNITGWAMQKDVASISGLLQVRLLCATNTNPGYYHTVQPSGFGVPMNQGVWTMFSATIDTSQSPSGVDCLPTGAAPGLVRQATLYLNQYDDMVSPKPELFLDDVEVTVTDGHNLVGNPNFEAGFLDGWSLSAGSSSLAISTTVAHGGTKSLRQSTRSIPAAGPRYALPTGPARYAISFWVQHSGTVARTLILQPTYTCIGGTQVLPPPIASVPDVAPGVWQEVSGMAVFPPANAPAGCKLLLASVYVQHDGTACGTGTGQVECPDLYIDDVSITVPTTTAP